MDPEVNGNGVDGNGGGGNGDGGNADGGNADGGNGNGGAAGARDEETEMIMGKVVSDSSARTYLNKNVTLIMWIFDEDAFRDLLLAPWCIAQLRESAEQDRVEEEQAARAQREDSSRA